MKDIYADDVWMAMVPGDKLVAFLEASLAAAVADLPAGQPGWTQLTPAADPDITAVNAAFALALVERHDLAGEGHQLYELAHAAGADADGIDLAEFKGYFADLSPDPDESEFRKALVDVTRAYATAGSGQVAD
jgi:hypothetical protein